MTIYTDAELAYARRALGLERNGSVSLRDFDLGVVLTLGAVQGDGAFAHYYFLPPLPGVCPASGMPGVPIVFHSPDDAFAEYTIPLVVVERQDIAPAMQRWHPGARQYRAPGRGAAPASLPVGNDFLRGFESYEERTSAVPYDFTYQVSVQARNRGAGASGIRNQANAVFMYVLSVYQPYSQVRVTDTVGDVRSYAVFADSMTMMDELMDVTDRTIGFGVTLRVEGELDLNEASTYPAVTHFPTIRESLKDG